MPATITLKNGDTQPLPEGIVTPEEWRLVCMVAAWAKANRVPHVKIHPWSQFNRTLPGVDPAHGLSVFPSPDAPTADLARSVDVAAGSVLMETAGSDRSFRLSMPL